MSFVSVANAGDDLRGPLYGGGRLLAVNGSPVMGVDMPHEPYARFIGCSSARNHRDWSAPSIEGISG